MPIPIADLGKVTEAMLTSLVGIAESDTLEFKRESYGSDDKSKRELCKDISALANVSGGDIILGMDERDGVAASLIGFQCADVNAEIQRLQNIVSMAIEPRISGVQFRALTLSNGSSALVIRVPRSRDLPHRVTHSGINRFYVRRTADTFEASLTELRRMFELAGSEFDNAERFCQQRIARVAGNRESLLLGSKNEGYYLLHIVPFGMSHRGASFDLSQMEPHGFAPLGEVMGYDWRHGPDGFMVYSRVAGSSECYSYTTVMRSGAVEAARGRLFLSKRDDGPRINAMTVGKEISRGLKEYIQNLRQRGASGPWIVTMTFCGCHTARLLVPRREWHTDVSLGLPITDPAFSLPSILIEGQTTAEEFASAATPMLDALWQAAGMPRFS